MLNLLFSLRDCFRTREALQAEILALRHQLLVLQRPSRLHKFRLGRADRALWVWLSRLWNDWRSALLIVKPETVVAWHRRGFLLYWTRKSRRCEGRPTVSPEVQNLIRQMSLANPRCGAPRPKRRRPLHFAITANPTADWTAHQLLEAFPWDSAPRYFLRDRDGAYGQKFSETAKWMGIHEVLTAPQSPWQNAYALSVSSVPFGANAWTTSLSSMRLGCAEYSRIISITANVAVRSCRSKKIHLSADLSSLPCSVT